MQHKLLIRLIHNLYCTYIQLRILYCSSQDSVELIIDVARTSDVLEHAMNSKGSMLPRIELFRAKRTWTVSLNTNSEINSDTNPHPIFCKQ